jgi:hypothetical protein
MTIRVFGIQPSPRVVRRIASLTLIAFAAAAACTAELDPKTAATAKALGSDGSDGSGSGGSDGSGIDGSMPVGCGPKPAPVPASASCLTANKTQWNTNFLFAIGTASGDYPIGIGQEGQPPPDAYRADVCERAWLSCVNGELLPQEGLFCSNACGGACAAPSAPAGGSGDTTWTVVPCGSIECWHITCGGRGCGAEVACCESESGSGFGF